MILKGLKYYVSCLSIFTQAVLTYSNVSLIESGFCVFVKVVLPPISTYRIV